MNEIIIQGHKIQYEVRESKRARYARIEVGRGGVAVILPKRTMLKPEDIIKERSSWVLKKQKMISESIGKIPIRVFKEGEKIPYLGTELTIRLTDREEGIIGNEILVPEDKRSIIEETVEKVFRAKAREIFLDKIDKYKHFINNEHNRVFIRDQKTKWASCSSKRNLNFNWRLLLAPEDIVEYVVVHELVHLDIHDHSEEFWSKVEEILPDYRKSKGWLKTNGYGLL